jgi:two-component system phosphate regulon sensor histidine kinase PhoR
MRFFFLRLMTLFFFAGVSAGIAALAHGNVHSIIPGVGLGFLLWLLWDSWSVSRFLIWLRRFQETADMPSLRAASGMWRETADRVYRLLRWQNRLLQESDHRLQNLQSALQASPNGVIVLDEKSRIEWCNKTACQHFGLDAQRDIAQSIVNLLRDPDFVAYLGARDFESAVALNSPVSTNAHPLRLSVQIFPYGQGRLFMLSQDITVLEQAEAIRRDFVANVSHEIRSPLTVLTGFIETLQTLPLTDDERQQALDSMARQAERMSMLVSDLLTLSRLENSPPPDLSTWTPVAKLLQDCETDAHALSALHTPAQDVPQHIVFPDAKTREAAGEIAGAAGELQSALFNLIHNAIRYTPPGGAIEVRWIPTSDGGACFEVSDNGPGVAPEHLPRLTERFYRVDSSRSRESGGTGLGLSIVKHVLQRHDAVLRIDSHPGKGSRFSITFPPFRMRGCSWK